jgi:putative membrane protein
MRPSDLVDAEARARLEAAVREAERSTGGEIVVAVVRASDAYASTGWWFGASLAALAFLALGLFAPPLPWIAYLAAQTAALALGLALARVDGVRRLCLRPEGVDLRDEERALRCFAEQGLTRTRGRTGILIFATLLERRVVVLADEGIDRALDPDESWQAVVDFAVDGMRRGAAAQGLEAAVRRCGAILARHLPPPAPNPDELPNSLVLED